MEQNPQLELAWNFLEQTGVNLFLTGKAGTGKTTFLHNLRKKSPKRMIVVAPTGVAAINAGGVTIHSFFQLPFGPYIPALQDYDSMSYAERSRLKMNFNREKISIIRSIDLLVIDEISMVRADLLDAINDVLQRYRDRNKPFGGVQMLMIGDLQQLAPVVKDGEWELLRDHYQSPFFFDSKALRTTPYVTLELKHIYRQSDARFINLLNRVRENSIDTEVLAELNSRYIPDFNPDDSEGYITLTSHNDAARRINSSKLDAIDAPSYRFTARVDGIFPEYSYPTDSSLELKLDAQVMFVKNDTSPEKRYFNGKIGTVSYIDDERIEVTVNDAPEPISVLPAEWSNARYAVDPDTKEITEEIDGVFTQYPLKAAWAITIHKSQGLTFERAIIDAAASFSHGQVYVALSRCRSFEGMILKTPLGGGSIISDTTVRQYNRAMEQSQPDRRMLEEQSMVYFRSLILEMFDFRVLRNRLRGVQRVFTENLSRLYPRLAERWILFPELFNNEILSVGEKFGGQITRIAASSNDLRIDPLLTERVEKGRVYFLEKCRSLVEDILSASQVDVDNKETKKLLKDSLARAMEELSIKLAVLGVCCENGFSVSDYLSARAVASIDKQKVKAAKSRKTDNEKPDKEAAKKRRAADGDIGNVELFEILRGWRKKEADEQSVAAFVIMHQRTLIEICNTLPESEKELLAIKGLGKKFVERYGSTVLGIVSDYVAGREG